MNNRRKLVIALGSGVLATPFGSFAQQLPTEILRIGYPLIRHRPRTELVASVHAVMRVME